MSSEQNSSRWPRVPWRLAGTAVLLIVIALLWWSGTRTSPLDQEITRRLAELRASGEPIDAQDLARLFPNPPPSEDAGELLTNILVFAAGNRAPASSPVVNPNAVLTRVEPFSEPAMVELRAYQQRTTAIWEQWPHPWPANMRFASHWERGVLGKSSPDLIQVRALAQMQVTLAMFAADDNDPQRAADMLERSFQFAQTMPSDSLVSHMIKTACVGLGVTATERCLNRTRFTESQLRQLTSQLPRTDTNHFSNALRGEHSLGIWVFEELKAGRQSDALWTGPSGKTRWWESLWRKIRLQRASYSDANYVRYLEFFRSSLECTKLPPPQAVARAGPVISAYTNSITGDVDWFVSTSWLTALKVTFEAETRLACLRIGLAVERFRLAHEGKIPTTLNELVPDYLPEVPRDIFDGQPLRFKLLPRGYVLYSIGADGADDGGLEKSGTATKHDVTITVER